MEITPSQLLSALSSQSASRSVANLETGQVITATVSKLLAPNLAELRIGQSTVQAKLTEVVQQGQQLRLEVQRQGETTQLRVVNQTAAEVDTLTNALRTALPKQTPLAPILTRLVQLTQTPLANNPVISDKVKNLIQDLVNQLPRKENLRQPQAVQQAIRQSGLFFESSLKQNSQKPSSLTQLFNTDLKARLLQISQALQQAGGNARSATPANPSPAAGSGRPAAPTSGQTQPATTASSTSTPTASRPVGSPITNPVTGQRQNTSLSTASNNNIPKPATSQPVNSVSSKPVTVQSQNIPTAATTTAKPTVPSTATPAADKPLLPASLTAQGRTGSAPTTSTPNPALAPLPGQASVLTDKGIPTRPGVTTGQPSPATANPSPRSDVPVNLIQVQQLADDIDAAVARIQMHQLNTVHAEETMRPTLIIELPVNNQEKVETFQLRIEQQDADENTPAHERLWRVSIDFDIEHLGHCLAVITVKGEHVTTDIWADSSTTTELFQQHSETLNAALTAAGLSVTRLQCHTGTPPSSTITTHKSLVNIQA